MKVKKKGSMCIDKPEIHNYLFSSLNSCRKCSHLDNLINVYLYEID